MSLNYHFLDTKAEEKYVRIKSLAFQVVSSAYMHRFMALYYTLYLWSFTTDSSICQLNILELDRHTLRMYGAKIDISVELSDEEF